MAADRLFFVVGSVSAFLAVAGGAFGAHILRRHQPPLPPDLLHAFEVGIQYQFFHALALLIVAWASTRWPGAGTAGWLFVAGTALFSGSLYALALTGVKTFGAVTPVGGVLFLLGWAWLAWAAGRG